MDFWRTAGGSPPKVHTHPTLKISLSISMIPKPALLVNARVDSAAPLRARVELRQQFPEASDAIPMIRESIVSCAFSRLVIALSTSIVSQVGEPRSDGFYAPDCLFNEAGGKYFLKS